MQEVKRETMATIHSNNQSNEDNGNNSLHLNELNTSPNLKEQWNKEAQTKLKK